MNEFKYRQNVPSAAPDGKLPMAVRDVVRLVNEPRTTVARLAAAVANHQTLADSVLRKANTSTYGFAGRVRNLNSAVVVLGFDALKETLRNVLIADAGRRVTSTVTNQQALWEHSIGCAIAARTLAERSGKCSPDDAFLAGILHDLGAVFSTKPEAGKEALRPSSLPMSTPDMRSMLEGMTRFVHAQVGASKAEEWGVQADIVEAIRFHHFPRLSARNPALVGVVHVAEHVCHHLHVGAAPFEQVDQCDGETLSRLGVPASRSIEELSRTFAPSLRSDVRQSPPLEAVVADTKQRLVEAMGGLPEEQRLIFALHYYEGLPIAEIGQLMEIPAATVGARLSGAVARLQNALHVQI